MPITSIPAAAEGVSTKPERPMPGLPGEGEARAGRSFRRFLNRCRAAKSTPGALFITLPCGCMTEGQRLFCYGGCVEHDETGVYECAACGQQTYFEEMNAKPTMTVVLHLVRKVAGQKCMLAFADRWGIPFDRLECRRCYGPGYTATEV